MKLTTVILLGYLFLPFISAAQDPSVANFEAPKKLPSSEREYKRSEPAYIKTAVWLESTPVDTTSKKRMLMNAWALAWIINCPYLKMEINEPFMDLVNKNPHLMFVGIANFVKYCLENNYKPDNIMAYTAAIKAVINCYILGGQLRADDDLTKAIEADKEGKLKEWVREAMKSE